MSAASRSVAVALALAWVALAASAAEAPGPVVVSAPPGAALEPGLGAGSADPVLVALVAEALERNPELRAAEAALAAARARPAQERSLPDPMLSVGYTNDGWSPSLGSRIMTRLALMWSQELPYPGKLGLRGEIAARGADQAERQLDRARRSLGAAAARAYYGLLLAREKLELVREQAEIWKQIEGVARARYSVGQGAQQDVLRVQVEVTRVEQLEAQQQTEAEIRQAEINRLRDRPLDTPLDTPARLALGADGEDAEALSERLRAGSPEIAAARLAAEAQRLAVRLAQREFKPDFSVQAGYMNRGGLDPMWQAGVGVRLPLRRERRQAGVAEAEARLRAAERRAEDLDLQLRYRTHERLARLRLLERIAHLYGNGIIPQDRMSVEAAVANYQAGKVPFVAVLEGLSTLYGDRSTYLGLLSEQATTRVDLEEARLDGGASMDLALPGMAGPAFGAGTMGAARPMSAE